MEIYIRIKGQNIERQLSLFQDEELELTRSWNEQQIISGYGSYSNTFTIPTDENNSEIFGFYDIIGATMINNNVDPNYFFDARLIVNENEFIGNIQLVGFSTKSMQPYSFQVVFYGDEKNLIKRLNGTEDGEDGLNKINNIELPNFGFTLESVEGTWSGDNNMFVPLMATQRPLVYRDKIGDVNNIYPVKYMDKDDVVQEVKTSGITMNDLAVSYNFSYVLDKMFATTGLTHTPSTQVSQFLDELYLMSTSERSEYNGDLSCFFTMASGITYGTGDDTVTILEAQNYKGTATPFLESNVDTTSFDINTDIYTIPKNGVYQFNFEYNINLILYKIFEAQQQLKNTKISSVIFSIINVTTAEEFTLSSSSTPTGIATLTQYFESGTQLKFGIKFKYEFGGWFTKDGIYTYGWGTTTFLPGVFSSIIRIANSELDNYNYIKSVQKYPDILISEFFINFCKTFNIFFIYDEKNNIVNTYFKNELPRNVWDLSNCILTDKDYTYNHKQLYKTIDYKFAEGKDINNLKYYESKGYQFGQNKSYYSYDVGKDKLEQKSIFTTIPYTLLYKTNDNNEILDTTNIPLHSELDNSLSPIQTDFLLFYRLPQISGGSAYNIQNALIEGESESFVKSYLKSNYGPSQQIYVKTGGQSGYTLDYSNMDIIDNISKRYETTLHFLMDVSTLNKIKIYDVIIVNGIYYEINDITTNINNGYTKMKLVTTSLRGGSSYTPPSVTTTTTTAAPCPDATTESTSIQCAYGEPYCNICLSALTYSPTGLTVSITIRDLNISHGASLKYHNSEIFEDQVIVLDANHNLEYPILYYANPLFTTGYTDNFSFYITLDCGSISNVSSKSIVIGAAPITTTTTTTNAPGTSGTSGTNGTSGSSGTDGTSGSSGLSGTSGSSGSSGTNGTSGTNGAQGIPGSSGLPGDPGTSGSSGSSGSSGVNGTNGSSGTDGTSGSSGISPTGET
ncbi:hypothetical protein M0Q97_10230 [Candidatus Dojkabacteria bacterium]|jgi:hypothetical protein|nr:hypothetical protein [Candidatus Dojkabacteria bacterium]